MSETKPGTVQHVLSNIESIRARYSLRSDGEAWFICVFIDALRTAESTNAELLRLLERHHKASIAKDEMLRDFLRNAEQYVGTELYLETEVAIKHAKEKV